MIPTSISDPVPVTLDITIDNLIIKNLATFDTKVAHLDLEKLSLELELGIADLRVSSYSGGNHCVPQGDADYTIDGTILGIFPVYGDGPMYLEVFFIIFISVMFYFRSLDWIFMPWQPC